MGFEDVELTSTYGGDGGIDVRGTLVVGDSVRIRMAVQAKRWKNNGTSPVVQQVRGSLGAHEQGLINTTSDFSNGAKAEASRSNAAPVALTNGEKVAELLAEYEILASIRSYKFFELMKKKLEKSSCVANDKRLILDQKATGSSPVRRPWRGLGLSPRGRCWGTQPALLLLEY